ncbi:MAG: hypothetical protein SFX73_08405 [Kofleriaceae bacterium]|nr:hypothetical protein [Kofleriaceae bacterium]
MARDVAQRQLDQAGFRISNIGTPTQFGDATRTDNTLVPNPSSGTGSPGSSLLAAPADHVHPASGDGADALAVSLEDPSYQTVAGTAEELVSEVFVDLNVFQGAALKVAFSAVIKASVGHMATFNVRLGGTPGAVDGTVVAVMSTPSATFIADDSTALNVPNPGAHQLLKITALTDSAEGVAHIYGKSVQLRPQAGA